MHFIRWPLSLLLLLATTLVTAESPPAVTELLRSAQLWDVKKRPDLAHMALEKLLLAYPDQPDALLQMGLMELRGGHPDVAARLLARARAAHPGELLTQQFDDAYRIATHDYLKMATIRRLSEKGQNEQAIAQLRALFPVAPPVGQLGLDYYRIINSGRGGWEEARAGYTRLMHENPEDPRYAVVLADHLLDRPATRPEAMKMLADLADNPDADHQRVLELWRGAMGRGSGLNTAMMRDYLKQAPDDRTVQRELDARARAAQVRELLANHVLATHWADDQAEQSALLDQLLSAAAEQQPGNVDVQASLGLLRMHQQRYDDAWNLFRNGRDHDASQARDKWHRMMSAAMFRKWTDESEAARQQGKLDLAGAKLRAALAIDGGHYYGMSLIANRLVQEGDATDAEDIYRRVLVLDADNDSSMRGLLALLSRSGRYDEAQRTLLVFSTAYPAMAGSFDYVRASLLRDSANAAIDSDHLGQGLRMLETAQELEPSDPWIRFDLAKLYARLELPRQARALMDEGVAHAQPDDTGIYYASALLLANLDDDRAAAGMLNRIPQSQRTDGMNSLAQRLKTMADRREMKTELAKADVADDTSACAIYAAQVARYPDDPDLRLSYARLLRRAGDHARAAAQLDIVLTQAPPGDQDTRLAVARERMSLDDLKGAHDIIDPMLKQTPVNPDVLVMAGRLARTERRYDMAMDYFHQAQRAGNDAATSRGAAQQRTYTGADQQIASLEDLRRGGFVTSGPSLRNKPGDAGVTEFTDLEWPVEWRQPLSYASQMFVHLDQVSASAGTLPADYDQAAMFGKVQAYGPGALSAFAGGVPQTQHGVDIGVGYQTEDWRFDLGTTPLGFLVHDIVGGVKYGGTLGRADYDINLSRRPVTSSLLSYAGARDPVTGEVWGGVRSTGVDLRVARYEGGWDASASAGFQRLTGRNVPGNNYFSARVSGRLNLINREDMRFSLGLAATQWYYGKDLSHYTFGQGGYYSPQSYTSLGIPLELTGRVGRFSYQLEGFVSHSQTRTDTTPFYPNDPALQAQAMLSPLPSGYGSPFFGGGSGSGIGYSAKGSLEYQVNSDYFIGGTAGIDRAAYYAPNFFSIYLRRMFDPWNKPMSYPPRPPRPYSQY